MNLMVKGPLDVLLVGIIVLTPLSQYSELDCEENKHEVVLFDKKLSPTPK